MWGSPAGIVAIYHDGDILDFLVLLLSGEGAEVITSDYTGDVAGAIRNVQPDLVLLDLQIPEDHQAGLVVLAQLRADAVTAAIPVILMTADHGALSQHAVRIQELGATPLPKPFDPVRLWQMIVQATA